MNARARARARACVARTVGRLQVTAQASPAFASIDTGTMPKLLGAYKVAVDGVLVAMGPGRSRHRVQGVDHVDVTRILLARAGDRSRAASNQGQQTHTIAVAAFHTVHNATTRYPWAPGAGTPRVALGIRLLMSDGTAKVVGATDTTWSSFDAQAAYRPSGNAGCVWYRQWQENINASAMPDSPWWLPAGAPPPAAGPRPGAGAPSSPLGRGLGRGWSPAAVQPPFASTLALKPTRPVLMRRVGVRLTKLAAGHYRIDTRREIQGGIVVRFAAGAAREGQVLQTSQR